MSFAGVGGRSNRTRAPGRRRVIPRRAAPSKQGMADAPGRGATGARTEMTRTPETRARHHPPTQEAHTPAEASMEQTSIPQDARQAALPSALRPRPDDELARRARAALAAIRAHARSPLVDPRFVAGLEGLAQALEG